MNALLLGTYQGKTYRLKVKCCSKTPQLKVQLLPSDGSGRITITQELGQSLPRYQAYLADGLLDVEDDSFMAFLERNELGHIVDYRRVPGDPEAGQPGRLAALFQFHSGALRRYHSAGCDSYEIHYARLKQGQAERWSKRRAG